MSKIDWKRKLSSRKLWVSVANFVTMMMIANGVDNGSAAQVSAIIMAGGALIAYVVGEGFADGANASAVTPGDVPGEETNAIGFVVEQEEEASDD